MPPLLLLSYETCVEESGASVGVDSALGEARRLAPRLQRAGQPNHATHSYRYSGSYYTCGGDTYLYRAPHGWVLH